MNPSARTIRELANTCEVSHSGWTAWISTITGMEAKPSLHVRGWVCAPSPRHHPRLVLATSSVSGAVLTLDLRFTLSGDPGPSVITLREVSYREPRFTARSTTVAVQFADGTSLQIPIRRTPAPQSAEK